ncbi:MAG: hypothetical protein K9N47_03085 [Prosthecobacter sp.]|uniref:hypothetical protein n=1 Tax=Prosthecobacter sp. TaxID=1965333 RepID=UPI0025D2BBDD|nr:hypothetical protein [Prosthecobacter sp.]MCF7785076.1 hypothetical protein [Prosthecobacter sp.]
MFFHHPETEQSLRRMAAAALNGTAMELRDLRLWPRIKGALKFVGWEAVLSICLCMLAGLSIPQFRAAAWRDFMLAGAVMMTSRLSGQQFHWLLNSSPTTNVLWHLPVAGRDICRWARLIYLRGSLNLLPRMTVVAWAWLGFPLVETAWMNILWSGIMLWLIMLACVQHHSLPLGAGRLLGKIWNVTLAIWGGLVVYAWVGNKHPSHGLLPPAWVSQVCAPVSWVLPAQWVMHARENQIALVLTLVCLVAGGLFWWRFPDALGGAYDQLDTEALPAIEIETEEPAYAEAEDLARPVAVPEPPAMEAVQVLACIQQAAANETSLVREGWIEKLLLSLLNERDRMLGPILVGLHAGWTGRWWKAVRICTLLLLTSYALLAFGTRWIKAETLEVWIVIVPLLVVVGYTFPVSNSIPLAMLSWPSGQHGMPLFAGLPISMRDLLRVSLRITVARMVACLALALPVIAGLCVLLDHPKAIPAMLGTAVILAISWRCIRPVFIYYRLQQVSRPGRRHRLWHACADLLILPIALAIPFSVILSVAVFQAQPEWLAVSLPLTACCARAVYAVFHWRVRAQKVDWTRDPPMQP